MSGYYFCIRCGDGPNNIDLNPYCPMCHTQQTTASLSSSHADCANANAPHAHPLPHTFDTMNVVTNTVGAQYIIAQSALYTTSSSEAPSPLVLPSGNAPYTAPHSQRPELPPVYRWQCCNCGADNSYKMDQGCATCCNHWRNTCCHVYDANNPPH